MTRISSRPAARPVADRAPAVKADLKKQLKGTLEKLIKGNLDFGKAPAGTNFVKVPLKTGKTDQYSYTALIPTGGKATDPNKADGFLLERSGGKTGRKEVAGPFTFEGKKLGKPVPFFEKFLEGQQKPGNAITTKRFPSDQEAVEPGQPKPPPGQIVTERYPSDNEGDTPVKPPGGQVTTMRYPSDNESDFPTKPTKPGGQVTTMRYPSDNESDTPTKPTKPGGQVTTMRYPSDNETIDTKPPGGMVTTMRYPSDNEDGNVR